MAYSSINAADDDNSDSVFESGGAIMDALNGKDPSAEEEKAKKPLKKGKNKIKKAEKSEDTEEVEPKPKEVSNTGRNRFIDGVLDANLSDDGYSRLKKKRKLNSYE
mgnify:CR=1 FL=1